MLTARLPPLLQILQHENIEYLQEDYDNSFSHLRQAICDLVPYTTGVFASGGVLSPALAQMLLVQSFFCRGIVDIVEDLVMGSPQTQYQTAEGAVHRRYTTLQQMPIPPSCIHMTWGECCWVSAVGRAGGGDTRGPWGRRGVGEECLVTCLNQSCLSYTDAKSSATLMPH